MKKIIFVLTLILTGAFMSTSFAKQNIITIKVTNINTKKPGHILAMLFSQKGFPKVHKDAIEIQTLPANESELIFKFNSHLEFYAIKILHDENGDGKVTKNWTTVIPAEGLGFSNGAKLSWRGAPTFKNAAIEHGQTHSQTISIIYP